MRGRPKLEDSRSNQYRVRLNDEENRRLDYVSKRLDKPKSEILRLALSEYYNHIRLSELNLEADEEAAWDMGTISLKRVVTCPYCNEQTRVDLTDECVDSTDERPMGTEILYEFDTTATCEICGEKYGISGYISEYPPGALDSEKIEISLLQSTEEDQDE